jgi:NADPH:quinone reductase
MITDAITFRASGGLEVISMGTLELPSLGPHDVLIEVAAAGINRADILQRQGRYPAPPGAPPNVPGLEFSGRIAERGSHATRFAPGDAVMAVVGGGAMAKHVVIHERELMPVPSNVPLVDAAAIPEAYLTAWDAFTQGQVAAGETVLIHAAASGVGTAAITLCRAMGVRPVATIRSGSKVEALQQLGVAQDDVIVVENGVFSSQVLQRVPLGVPFILDCVGASYVEENLRALALCGRMVMIGTLGGLTGPAFPVGLMLGKRATVIGSVMRARSPEEKMSLAQRATMRLLPMFERGQLRPLVSHRLPMAQCVAGHQLMESNENIGKVILHW